MPRVSVLMSVYNGEEYLRPAVDSILRQTFRDFEFLIVNDASADQSINILQSYNDPRIKIIQNPQNVGLAQSLNNGLKKASGEYIARMDCDDISFPTRLADQVAFMEVNEEVGISGTWIKNIGKLRRRVWKPPTDAEAIRCYFPFWFH